MALLFISNIATAEICQSWSPPLRIGSLDKNVIMESSGLQFSRQYPDRTYHINDSGDGPTFYYSKVNGSSPKRVSINNYVPKDVEDIGLGPCGEKGETCLFISDMGDNLKHRKDIKFVLIKEMPDFPAKVDALKIVVAKYPGKAHNAEGMAIHPNGDLYIFTKEKPFLGKAKPTQIFRLTREQMRKSGVQTLTHLGEIDLPDILQNVAQHGRIVTSMDIHPNGKKFILLTYDTAVEFDLDLSRDDIPESWYLIPGVDYQILPIKKLKQQEAIAYSPWQDAVYYTSESKKEDSPIYRLDCKF